jgi:hypothetical protein
MRGAPYDHAERWRKTQQLLRIRRPAVPIRERGGAVSLLVSLSEPFPLVRFTIATMSRSSENVLLVFEGMMIAGRESANQASCARLVPASRPVPGLWTFSRKNVLDFWGEVMFHCK